MWTISFDAHGFGYTDEPEKIVGVITAIFNAGLAGEIRVERKINLGDDEAVDAFIADAKSRQAAKSVPAMIKTKTDAILSRLNEK